MVLALSISGAAHARCPAPVDAWVRACAASSGLDVTLRSCHPDGFVLEVHGPPDRSLDVDVQKAHGDPFRRVGDMEIGPIGEFDDWSREPEGRRLALDGVTACVRRAAPPIGLIAQARDARNVDTDGAHARSALPWLLLGLVAGAFVRLLALARELRRRPAPPPGILRDAVLVVGISAATFAVRRIAVASAFFHQNGQGPGWIEMAWRRVTSVYGPGYAELYGWIASLRPGAPEGAVFFANACAGAMLPALAYALAGRASSSRLVAGGAGLAVAVSPIGARLAQSESYFFPITWLLFVAALALTDASRDEVRGIDLAADRVIAALCLAQAVRIHPVAWVPAAMTLLVVLTGPSGLRAASRRTATSFVFVGASVLVLAGRTVWDVLHGSLGRAWMPSAGAAAHQSLAVSIACVLSAAWLLTRAWSHEAESRRLVTLALLAVVGGVATRTNLVGPDLVAVNAAHAWLYAPVVLAIASGGAQPWLAALVRHRRVREGACGLGLATAGVVSAVASARTTLTLPTDAREQSWALEWRGTLPTSATVFYYGHAGERVLDLPLYRGAVMPGSTRLEDGWGGDRRGEDYYVHTSLCSTADGKAQCDRFESTHRLEALQRRVLPGLPSLPSLPFTSAAVEVVLYRLAD